MFLAALVWAAIAHAQPIPQKALDQISALMREKESRTPVQKKIASHLLFAQKMKHGLPVAPDIDHLDIALKTDAQDRVLVDINAPFSKELIALVEAMGGSVVYASKNQRSMRAWLPLDNVDNIAARKDVSFVQPAIPAYTNGINISEGVVAHRVDQARSTLGASGAGIKIGVLSDSADFLSAVQASGDLGPVTVLPGQTGSGSGEGTAMLEIVHDVAPDAQLFFATAFTSEQSFADNIVALRNAGCDIIVDDVLYLDESPFQDATIAQAVNTVTASGALYFSSAGNDGSALKGTSSVWEGDFVDSGSTIAGISGQIHSFGASNSDRILAPASPSTAPVMLFWSDPLGASTNDYDLFLIDNTTGAVVDASTDVQNGTQDPFEFILNGTSTKRIVIAKSPSAAPRFLHVNVSRGKLQTFTNGQTFGHSCAADAYGVAAARVPNPPAPFTGASSVETFSSDGPRRMFYAANGTPFTPGNVSSTGGILRNKPDITAADGVSCATPGFNPFFGTSAAAPHAAAIAALLKQMIPAATPAQIRTALTTTATDIETAGVDVTTGAGIVNAAAALTALGAVAQPFITMGTVTATPASGATSIIPGDTVNVTVVLANGGGVSATGIQGVLTTTSAGVTITSATRTYPSIAAAGSASNSTPFSFTLAPTATCGAQLTFTLTVTFAQSAIPRIFTFTLGTGGLGTPMVFSYTDPPAPIPDNSSTGVNVPLTVSGLPGAIGKVVLRIDGSSCSTTAGDTNAGIDHTFVGDLVINLISPTGTSVNVIDALTNGADNNSGHNFCNTVLDDAAATSVQGLGALSAPFTGTFSPASPLSAFNGENGNGTWTLRVVDIAAPDSGNVRKWSLVITPKVCLGPPASVIPTAGTPQSAPIGTPFTTALQAVVKDSNAHPLSNVTVNFTAPNSGASATFPNGGVVATDTNGVATITATANGTTGSYNATATVGALTATFALTNTVPAAPTNVIAAAQSATSVQITWTNAVGGTSHEIARSSDGVNYTTLSMAATSPYTDSPVGANKAFLYKVRANAPLVGPYSAPDLANTFVFSNAVAAGSIITARDFNETRAAIEVVRAMKNLGPYPYTETIAQGTVIKALHLIETRHALDDARSALLLPPLLYTNSAITAATSAIFAADINDLRNGAQ